MTGAGRRVEIGRLVSNPRKEARDAGMSAEDVGVTFDPAQFRIGHLRMDGAMTDRMDRHGVPPSPAPGDGMMPFDTPPERTGAEPAKAVRALRHQDLVQLSATHLPVVFAFMAMFMPLGAPVIFMSMCIS